MMAVTDTERFEREDEYEDSAEREAREQAERVRDIIDDVRAAAELAVTKLKALNVLDQWAAGEVTPCGFQKGRYVPDESMIDQVRSDAAGSLIPWLREDVKALVEE